MIYVRLGKKTRLTKIARVALRGKPQLLEKIGVAARTSKTSAQRAARRKETTRSECPN